MPFVSPSARRTVRIRFPLPHHMSFFVISTHWKRVRPPSRISPGSIPTAGTLGRVLNGSMSGSFPSERFNSTGSERLLTQEIKDFRCDLLLARSLMW